MLRNRFTFLLLSFTVWVTAAEPLLAEGGLPPMPPLRPGEYLAPPAFGEFHPDRLKVGEEAPLFTLPDVAGQREVMLSDHRDKEPVVLVFGNYTCPVFRGQIGEIHRIFESYKARAAFYLIYIREAHPGSRLYFVKNGKEVLETIGQTNTWKERVERAKQTIETFRLTIPTLVDKVDNAANIEYAGWPVRFVVVARDGRLAFKGRMGPYGFWAKELAAWVAENLP